MGPRAMPWWAFSLKYLRRGKNKIKKNKVLRYVAETHSTRASAQSVPDNSLQPSSPSRKDAPPLPQRRETEVLFGAQWLNNLDLSSDDANTMSSSDMTSDGSVYEPAGGLPSSPRDSAVSKLLPPAPRNTPVTIEVIPALPALPLLDSAVSIPVHEE